MTQIAILDYGVGNLRSISNAVKKKGGTPLITKDIKVIEGADGLILPGVGAFSDALTNISPYKSELIKVITSGKPILGICLGLQILFTESTEGGAYKGLNVFKGRVLRLPSTVKIPHIGWNQLKIIDSSNSLVEGIKQDEYVYFVHSYYPQPEEQVIVAVTQYGVEFPSIISKKNIYATQFHPEKSGKTGMKIVENFIKITKK
ncbi:MAG: imidazole glycerol phosphate synthase subunit HisH [Candidatus Odinarchaeia archaeon]